MILKKVAKKDTSVFFIPRGRLLFPEDTWIILSDIYAKTYAYILQMAMVERKLTHRGDIPEQMMNAIKNCILKCPDVERKWKKIISK